MKFKQNFNAYLMPRSGTTLFSNLLKEVFEISEVSAGSHNVSRGWVKPIAVIRDFRDTLASNWRIYHANIDGHGRVTNKINGRLLDNMLSQTTQRIQEFEKFRKMYPKHLLIKYEDFWDNPMYIFDEVSKWLGIKFNEDVTAKAIGKYSLENCKLIVKNLGGDFDNIDKDTNLHAKHIYTGKPGTWKEFINPSEYAKINKVLGESLIKYGYKLDEA